MGYYFDVVKDPSQITDFEGIRKAAAAAGFTHFMPASREWRPIEEFGVPGIRYLLHAETKEIYLIIGEQNLIEGAYNLK